MNEQDRARFVTNVRWFNQFFDSVRQLYEIVVESLPKEFLPENFAMKSGNFFFPRGNFAPSIPPYYVLMLQGRHFAIQVLAVFDADLFGRGGLFVAEPSLVVILHSRPDRYGYIEDYGVRLLGNRGVEIAKEADGKFWGKINGKLPVDFFSFQVSLDRFPAERNVRDAVREYIVDPMIKNIGEKQTPFST